MNYTTVAIIGRPNVGKSTLFNVLTRSRQAIVDDQAGVTLDRHYGYATIAEQQLIVVDTGGYTDNSEQPLQKMLNEQVMLAIEESDVLLLVVDSKQGVTALDQEMADKIRKTGKPYILVANKAENLDELSAKQDFYSLGSQIVHISAAHRHGIVTLGQKILEHSSSQILERKSFPSLAIIGRPNAGKSTLTNSIIGRKQVLVSEIPGTTRDSIYLDFKYKDQDYQLIDTAGLRRKSRISAGSIERYSVLRSMKAIIDADVVLLMIDASLEISEQDCRLYNHVQTIGRPLIVVLNKWDLLDDHAKKMIKRNLDFKLRQVTEKDVITCTAIDGYGISRIIDTFISKYSNAQVKISTAAINTVLQVIMEENPPPSKNGKRPRFTYANVAGYKPHKIIIHGKRLEFLSDDYKRFIQRTFQSKLKLGTSPVKIIYK